MTLLYVGIIKYYKNICMNAFVTKYHKYDKFLINIIKNKIYKNRFI